MAIFKLKNATAKTGSLSMDFFGTSSIGTDETAIAAYTTCLKILSETIGKMPLHLYKYDTNGKQVDNEHQLNDALFRPNPYFTPFAFWQTMEYNRNHYGNAYAFIERFKNGQVQLWALEPDAVEILVDSNGLVGRKNALYYRYRNSTTREERVYSSEDVIHLRFFATEDDGGLKGKPARDVIASTFANMKQGEQLVSNMFKNGLHSKNALYYDGVINERNAEMIKRQLIETVKGVSNAGETIPLPTGFQLKPIQGGSLADAQYLELTKFNAQQIAAVFGITPSQLNDYSGSSYATSEYQQLNFYVNTLQAILTAIEQELNYKLLTKDERRKFELKFNINAIMRGDFKSQVETLAKAVNNGIMDSNEARQKLDLQEREEGGLLMCNSNYVPVDMVKERAQSTLENQQINRLVQSAQLKGAENDEQKD